MMFALGFISGILITGFLFIIVAFMLFSEQVKQMTLFFNQSIKKALREGKIVNYEDIEILEPVPVDIEAMEKVFEENDKKGRDTKISELDNENI